MSSAYNVKSNAYLVILFSMIVMLISAIVCICPPKATVSAMPVAEKPVYYTRSIESHPIDPKSIIKEARDPVIHDETAQVHYYINQVTDLYDNLDADLIRAVVYTESSFNPRAQNGIHVGLMQLSTKWQAKRAKSLGVIDMWDPYDNILVGTSFLNDLIQETNGDIEWALMIYNGGYDYARNLRSQGIVSSYAKNVLAKYWEYREVGYAE